MGVISSVGRRHGRNSRNRITDQKNVQDLLNRIPASAGGAGGTLNERMVEGICSDNLYLAIVNFQKKNVPQFADGHVDPGGRTLDAMERMAKINDFLGTPDLSLIPFGVGKLILLPSKCRTKIIP